MSNEEIITCPKCLHDFKHSESFDARKQKMAKTLVDSGFSLREIGRVFKMHPQSVKYWSKKQ